MLMMEVLLLAWAGGAVAFDLYQRRLPNVLTLGGFSVGIGILLVSGQTPLEVAQYQAWLAVGLAVLLTLPAYAVRLLGAGDVKLAAAIAILTGLSPFITVYVFAAFLSLGMVLMFRYAPLIPYLHRIGSAGAACGAVDTPAGRSRTIPFGAALGIALVGVLLARHAGYLG